MESIDDGNKSFNTKIIVTAIVSILLGAAFVLALILFGMNVQRNFDNKTAESGGTEYSAFQRVEVYVNGERAAKLSKRDRGMATWIGQHFKMELEVTANKGDEPKVIPVSIRLPYSLDGIVVNLPELVAGLPQEVWQSEFVPMVTVEDVDEEVITEDDMLGDF